MNGYPERFEITKNQLRKAGKKLSTSPEDRESLEKVNKWRASHAYPLHIIFIAVKNKAKKFGKRTIVAQRLKRMPTILNKLERHRNMRLHMMQDIGGVRVILPDMNKVRDFLENASIGGHYIVKENDYITSPKLDGYRGYHIVYEYNNTGKSSQYNGLFVELQVRTAIQHEWATAVEMVGLATHKHLKLGDIDPNWANFFKLVSRLFAMAECPELYINDQTTTETIKEFYRLEDSMKAVDFLKGISAGIKFADRRVKAGDYLVLSVDFLAKIVSYHSFSKYEEALEFYTIQEEDRNKDSVLVSVGDMRKMKSAYPNYFMDIGAFCARVESLKEVYEEIFSIDKT